MCLTLRRSALAVLIVISSSSLSFAFKSVGNDEMPTLSFFSHGIYVVSCPGRFTLRTKSSGSKCLEHIQLELEGSHLARLRLTKSTHRLRLFIASGLESPSYGILWKIIPFLGSGVLEQPNTTQREGISNSQAGKRGRINVNAYHALYNLILIWYKHNYFRSRFDVASLTPNQNLFSRPWFNKSQV